MTYHDDLLDQALHLARRDPTRPKQASLRRAVSTAYYALFHLLISEAVSYWRLKRQRTLLARSFDHRKMKGVCHNCRSQIADLRAVAKTFVDLQDSRHRADYDNSGVWTKMEAMSAIKRARTAFTMWRGIKTHAEAQGLLLSLFAADRR
jgi:uncharacterized protein (UPF0332 family)